jgi:hypothetical protein
MPRPPQSVSWLYYPFRLNMLALGLQLALLVGCTSYGHAAYRLVDGNKPGAPDPGYSLKFVEADDEGWLWSPTQAEDAIEAVNTAAAEADTYVVLFVHGWHHSARCCDGNVEGFKETLARLHAQLSKLDSSDSIPPAGSVAPNSTNFRLVGIYVGWRGASLPGFLDYFTFWGRKSAAQRTGEGDLREFLDRLNQVYRRHNEAAESAGGPPNTFLGLVTIGHSFGAQVLLRSVSAALEQQLQTITPDPGYLRGKPPAQLKKLHEPLHGFGDLVILVNPAVESAAYKRIQLLSQQFSYPTSQTPVMLTVSAENDVWRGKPFRIGRILGEWFTSKPYKADVEERESERQALGIYSETGVITHRLQPLDSTASLVSAKKSHPPEPNCALQKCECDWLEWRKPPAQPIESDSLSWNQRVSEVPGSPGRIPGLEEYDFSKRTVFDNVELVPVAGAQPNQPFIVASADRGVIDGHNGIFSAPFIDFLTHYIGFIEGKEYLLTLERQPSKHTSKPQR